MEMGERATPIDDAADDHLTLRVRFGLQEHRVHPHVGFRARCAGLQPLRDIDLAGTVGGTDDPCVVRHVLRFERRHPHALPVEPRAQSGDQQRLAGIGGAAEHHQRALIRRHHGPSAGKPRRGTTITVSSPVTGSTS